ncbi:hypothetical protein EDD41_2726 [Luteococcus japonicus]|uniref:Peptidase M41-like protein n=1 Tax=Luteococcus japonicus TaxID=33984 RepID=A0A3N1ZZ88_9ACTN|nr:hypothetical protein [Luteococcus japonicus]ROR55452.1 hypothetical protein EDD41_2726 [Luteococcus japonicus]
MTELLQDAAQLPEVARWHEVGHVLAGASRGATFHGFRGRVPGVQSASTVMALPDGWTLEDQVTLLLGGYWGEVRSKGQMDADAVGDALAREWAITTDPHADARQLAALMARGVRVRPLIDRLDRECLAGLSSMVLDGVGLEGALMAAA